MGYSLTFDTKSGREVAENTLEIQSMEFVPIPNSVFNGMLDVIASVDFTNLCLELQKMDGVKETWYEDLNKQGFEFVKLTSNNNAIGAVGIKVKKLL